MLHTQAGGANDSLAYELRRAAQPKRRNRVPGKGKELLTLSVPNLTRVTARMAECVNEFETTFAIGF